MQRFLSGAGFALACAALAAGAAQAASHEQHRRAPQNPDAAADATTKSARRLSVTVYNDDLVLVQDVRTLDVPAGRSRIEFPEVSASIHPETASISGKGLAIVEQNFDYDLLTPAKMMEKAVGRQIQVVHTNPATGRETAETATVLSVNAGVVLKIGGRIEALRDDGLPTRVVFDSIPENLRASPTLSVTVDAAQAGPRQVTLSYLATGLSWASDYVGLFDEKQGTMALQGWFTMKNRSGTSFKDAGIELIAGSVNTSVGAQTYRPNQAHVEAGTGAASTAAQLADYYDYHLPERLTIADQQTKQVSFLDLHASGASKSYEYQAYDFSSAPEPAHASVIVWFANGGDPLPEGTIRVYMRDSAGEPKFVGESGLGHTPAGSKLSVMIGDAFDVTVQPQVVASEKLGSGSRYAMSYTLRNARPVPVTVALAQRGLGDDGRVVAESQKSERLDAHTLAWDVDVPAHGRTVLTFTVETDK